MEEQNQQQPEQQDKSEKKGLKRKIAAVLMAVLLICAGIYLINEMKYESTDDAYVENISVNVSPKVSGQIENVYIKDNQYVSAGELVATIDSADYQVKFNQADANYERLKFEQANAKANLVASESNIELAKKDLERYRNLYAKNFVAKSELDHAESDYRAKLASIGAQRASIAQARANYKTAMTNLGYTKIVAPVDGTIIKRAIDVGQPVAASFQAPELFTIAQDLKEMQIEVNVSEADIGKVKEGQDVEYTLDGYPDSIFHGKVTQVRLDSTTTSNVVTYTVIVSVSNEDLTLKPGMTLETEFVR
jgi:HlyD family secretion protein